MTESDLVKISKVIGARLSKLSPDGVDSAAVKYCLVSSREQELLSGVIKHGKYLAIAEAFKQMQIGDVIKVDPCVASGIRVVSRRANIKIIQRKRGDYIAVQRLS
jgi:hypothetical protein